uniref:F-box/LRR-repeat protein 15-like leucin rich repeat domain-containing protein n=1 Tax=Fagus sylvatica TaxID=28930 RepID=A0A2N9J5G7_FAGSY
MLLSVLTEDLLIRVYGKLGSDSDRKTWRIVCKDFLRVDWVTRRSLRVLRSEFLQGLLSKYKNLDTLDLSVCPRIEDASVSVMLSQAINSVSWTRGVTRLVLSRASGLRYAGLERLVGACPCLEVLDVSYCWVYGDREAWAISSVGKLRELRMDKCLGVTDVGLAKIAVGCGGRLERLSLKWCMEISDLGVDLLCKKCLELKELDVSYLKITSESLRSIASLPKLEVLLMAGCPFVDDYGLQFLENGCPSLQVIDVSRCGCVSSSGLISVIRGHSSLAMLNAGYCFSELSANVLHCLKDLKNLKTIRLDRAPVSDSSFQTIGTNCKSLVEIGLSKCVGRISALANSCRNLLSLKLEACDKVTEKSLDQLGSCCLRLEELDLTDCCGVNDEGLKYLSRCSELLSLKLGLCSNISDKGLAYIARNCTKISELDLYRCTGIGDDGLVTLSSGCKKLTKLNLSYCNGVTDRGMQYIGHLGELSDLEMRGLVNLHK